MKRQLFITTLISLFVLTGTLSAQNYTFRVSYSEYDRNEYDRPNLRKDIRELERFQRQVDRFMKAANRDQLNKARRIKGDIMHQMRAEIADTRFKIRQAKYELRFEHNRGLRKKGYGTQQYSKRERTRRGRSKGSVDDRRDLNRLQNQLNQQIGILFELENTYLDRSRRFWKQLRAHERLMYRFEETLHRDIRLSRAELREDLYGR